MWVDLKHKGDIANLYVIREGDGSICIRLKQGSETEDYILDDIEKDILIRALSTI